MINLMYRVLETIINKEQSGYLSPDEFNNVAHLVQSEIFRNYFEDINRDRNKENKGLVNEGYGDLVENESQRIEIFVTEPEEIATTEVGDHLEATLPEDLYILPKEALLSGNYKVIEKVRSNAYLRQSIAGYSKTYPIYTLRGDKIRIFPNDIETPVTLSYIRTPKKPMWTYVNVDGNPKFNPSSTSFQDFELHESEFANIAVRMLTHFGINLREAEVVQIAERLKQTLTIKDNS